MKSTSLSPKDQDRLAELIANFIEKRFPERFKKSRHQKALDFIYKKSRDFTKDLI
jgi:hypothetical protein